MWPPPLPQLIVGFRLSDFPHSTQTGADEDVDDPARKREWIGESRKGGGGRRRKEKWPGGWEAGRLAGAEGRTTTEAICRAGRGGSAGGTGEEREGER